MNLCDEISIHANNNCNIMFFDDGQINWLNNEIKCQVYPFTEDYVTMEAGNEILAQQQAEADAREARRSGIAIAGDDDCTCGYYDCYYYECDYYDYYDNLLVLERDWDWEPEFRLMQGDEEEDDGGLDIDGGIDGIGDAFACDEGDETCVPEGEEGMDICRQAAEMPIPLRSDSILVF